MEFRVLGRGFNRAFGLFPLFYYSLLVRRIYGVWEKVYTYERGAVRRRISLFFFPFSSHATFCILQGSVSLPPCRVLVYCLLPSLLSIVGVNRSLGGRYSLLYSTSQSRPRLIL
jgi:hypothetical protein